MVGKQPWRLVVQFGLDTHGRGRHGAQPFGGYALAGNAADTVGTLGNAGQCMGKVSAVFALACHVVGCFFAFQGGLAIFLDIGEACGIVGTIAAVQEQNLLQAGDGGLGSSKPFHEKLAEALQLGRRIALCRYLVVGGGGCGLHGERSFCGTGRSCATAVAPHPSACG